MQQYGAALTDIFGRGLKDAEQAIRIETLRAVGAFLNELALGCGYSD